MPSSTTSILRNRNTGEIFDASGKPLKRRFDFSVKPKPSIKPAKIKVAVIPEEKTTALLDKFNAAVEEGGLASNLKLIRQYPMAFKIALYLTAAYFNLGAAAASATYSCTAGSWDPTSACSLTDTSCRFGVLSLNDTVLATFMTKVVQDAGAHDNTPFTFYDCMTIDKVCAILEKLFNASSNPSKTISATGQGPTINGTYLYSTVSALPIDVEPGYQGAFSAQAAQCDSFAAQLKADLKLLALLVLILIPIAIYVYRDEIKAKLTSWLTRPDLSSFRLWGGSQAAASTPPLPEPTSYPWSPTVDAATKSTPTLSLSPTAPESRPTPEVALAITTPPAEIPPTPVQVSISVDSATESSAATSFATQPARSPRQFQPKAEPELPNADAGAPPPPSYDEAVADDQADEARIAVRM